uniref:Protein root UVB sensitive/RUS domain-containing protein n=1 Tax=Pygocentrus nattereri TaxID=42514 RepID=A0AAR2JGV0_PYGNA
MKRERVGEDGEKPSSSITAAFKSVFLPQGYPESVSEDYLQYQLWDTLQAFSSSLSGTLATQASLRGVGVGNQEATVAAATVTWLLRDGTGMLGRILFAWLKGSKLDSEAKKWRLFADILNDIAMFMEIAAPHFPPFFTLIVCIAGIFKSIVGVAGGATRAALTVHQARRNNMADISAKDGSQETLVNLAGLLVSLVLIPLVTNNPVLTFILFFCFTVLHLFANYKAVRSVVMETLNEARLSIILHQYLLDGRILSPAEANQREPVVLETPPTLWSKVRGYSSSVDAQFSVGHPHFKSGQFLTTVLLLCGYFWVVAHPHLSYTTMSDTLVPSPPQSTRWVFLIKWPVSGSTRWVFLIKWPVSGGTRWVFLRK